MNLGERRPNKWWTETDTFAMLTLIEQLDLVHELDKKRQRNDSHFRRLRHSLAKRHIHFTVNQIRNRWKSLKHKYRKIKTASYRSPAARLSAMESFRYFRMLDRMLAHRPRMGAPEEGSAAGHDLVVLNPSDLEDHTDSTGDVTQACTAAPWHDPLIPKLESGEEVKPDPDETQGLDQPDWAVNGTDEVMTLGLSGEYLGSVKAEPIPSSALHNLEGAREPTSCSSEEFQGTCEDTSSLILQQLTILNHQLSEQLAEQRAFHCSMLGMMDRQIEVLEQLSSFTRGQQEARAATIASASISPSFASDECLSRRVHEALLRMQRRNAGQALTLETLTLTPPLATTTPCLSGPSPAAELTLPSWTAASLQEFSTQQEGPGPAHADVKASPKEEAELTHVDVKASPEEEAVLAHADVKASPEEEAVLAQTDLKASQKEEGELTHADVKASPKEETELAGDSVDNGSQPGRQPSSPRKGVLVNGLLDSCQDQ